MFFSLYERKNVGMKRTAQAPYTHTPSCFKELNRMTSYWSAANIGLLIQLLTLYLRISVLSYRRWESEMQDALAHHSVAGMASRWLSLHNVRFCEWQNLSFNVHSPKET